MRLFVSALERETARLHKNGIRLRIVGDLSMFDARIQELVRRGETRTAGNTRMTLTIAANYGGRWDILQAASQLVARTVADGHAVPVDEASFAQHLAMAYAPEPDLFIRTGVNSASATSCCGNSRIPNSISPTHSGRTSMAQRSMLR